MILCNETKNVCVCRPADDAHGHVLAAVVSSVADRNSAAKGAAAVERRPRGTQLRHPGRSGQLRGSKRVGIHARFMLARVQTAEIRRWRDGGRMDEDGCWPAWSQ